MSVVATLQSTELPQLLNNTGLLPTYPPGTPEDEQPAIDLAPLKHLDLVLCVGKEWHRFSGHYLVPVGVRVEFIKSDFQGQLPRHFKEIRVGTNTPNSPWWPRPATRYIPTDVNDLNKEDLSRYVRCVTKFHFDESNFFFSLRPQVSPDTCDYLIDLDYPLHPIESRLEPRYATQTETWERVVCKPFLDARHSSLLTRTLWLPGKNWEAHNEFGEYCLLKNGPLVKSKQDTVMRLMKEGKLEL